MTEPLQMTKFQATPAQFVKIPRGAIKVPIPDVTQKASYSCGAVCLEAICHYYGVCMDDEAGFVRHVGDGSPCGCQPRADLPVGGQVRPGNRVPGRHEP